ncbi:hypothetical protein GCM10009739_00790 [Microbacterium ulmi]
MVEAQQLARDETRGDRRDGGDEDRQAPIAQRDEQSAGHQGTHRDAHRDLSHGDGDLWNPGSAAEQCADQTTCQPSEEER